MEESRSDGDEVDCSQGDSSMVSIVTIAETTLDDSSAAVTTTSQIDSDNNLQNQGQGLPKIGSDNNLQNQGPGLPQIGSDNNLQNQGPGLHSVPVTSQGNVLQDGGPMIDIPVNRSNDAVVIFRVSLADFGKIPVHQIFH